MLREDGRKGCRPGCLFHFLFFVAIWVAQIILRRAFHSHLAPEVLAASLLAFMVVGFLSLWSNAEYSFTIETGLFLDPALQRPHPGDLPGSELIDHLANLIRDRVDAVGEAIPCEGGWGRPCLKGSCQVWISVEFQPPRDGPEVGPPRWRITTCYETWQNLGTRILRWPGARLSRGLHRTIRSAMEAHPGVRVFG